MEFNFKSLKKEYFRITLPSDVTLTLKPPKYSDFKRFARMGEEIKNDEDAFKAIASILNMNMEGITVTIKNCEEMFDVADAFAFMSEYANYLKKITEQKN